MNNPENYKHVKIHSNIEIAPDVFVIKVDKPFNFVSGQIAHISVDKNQSRMYSILSGENEAHLSFLYNIVPEGYLTQRLSKLQKNDYLYLSEPFGTFLNDFENQSYFIATGTGIAPFYSKFKSSIGNFTLIQGARSTAAFYFQEEFKSLGASYVRCLSKGHETGYFSGRLSKYLEYENLPVDKKYYLCGNAEMVVDVRELLIKKGVDLNNIQTEIYF
jgi:ferredoxin--NADP+ reductase